MTANESTIAMDAISAAPAADAAHPVTEKAQTANDISEISPAPVDEGVLGGDLDQEKRDMEMPGQDLQQGVQDVEAITLSWTKWHLAAVLFKCVAISPLFRQIQEPTLTASPLPP